MRGGKHVLIWATLVIFFSPFVASRAEGQTIQEQEARRTKTLEGADTFRSYCAPCHGVSAKGDGPAAKALKKTPADLTGITKRHGKFSATDVEAVIVGNQENLSNTALFEHGSRTMPIWGPVFQAVDVSAAFTQLRIKNLVDYLRSIQAP